jgi:serine/threonine protein kinase
MSQGPGSDERSAASQGQRIAHYRIVSRLGSGGMGVVYRADDTKLRRTVALKVLHPEVADKPDRRKRFLREGRLAGVLTHPCIATVYDVGEDDDRIYIAMELVEGELLGQKLKRGALPFEEAIRITREIARGLTKAHEAGVIHRDLKPDNIMIGPDGIVKILDFGVAKPTDTLSQEFTEIKTQHGSLVGTPAYMSPEQASGKTVDARSDIFSVGVLLYEMLAGKRPFSGDTWQEIIISINRDSVEPIAQLRSDVPPDVDHVLSRCLAKSALERYRRCRELVEDLGLLLSGSSTMAPGAGPLLTLSPMPGSPPLAARSIDSIVPGAPPAGPSSTPAPSTGEPSTGAPPSKTPALLDRTRLMIAIGAGAVVALLLAAMLGVGRETPGEVGPRANDPSDPAREADPETPRLRATGMSGAAPSASSTESNASAMPATADAPIDVAGSGTVAAKAIPPPAVPSGPPPSILSPTGNPQVQPPPASTSKPANPILGF